MKNLFMVIAALMLTVTSQAQSEMQKMREELIEVIDHASDDFSSIYSISTSFSDKEDAMIIIINKKVDVDLTAKKMWDSVHDTWNSEDQKLFVQVLKVKYLKVIIIDYNGDRTEYKKLIIS